MNTIELVIYVLSVVFVVLTLPFSLFFVMKVEQYCRYPKVYGIL